MRIEFVRIICYYSDEVIAMPKKPREMEQSTARNLVGSLRSPSGNKQD